MSGTGHYCLCTAELYGEIHEYYGTATWQKLSTAIAYFQIEIDGHAHDAGYDAQATAALLREMASLADRELPAGWHPPVLVPCSGCGQSVREFMEADHIWYCFDCGLERGLYHRCPRCKCVLYTPDPDEMCDWCVAILEQEARLAAGDWHRCIRCKHALIKARLEDQEYCENCVRQLAWMAAEKERQRLRKEAQDKARRETQKLKAQERRKRLREEKEQAQRRKNLGLPDIATTPSVPVATTVHGHQCIRLRGERPGWQCTRCWLSWTRLPESWCTRMLTFRGWANVPEIYKSRTALQKLHLQTNWDKPHACVLLVLSPYRRDLYDSRLCIPAPPGRRTQKQTHQ